MQCAFRSVVLPVLPLFFLLVLGGCVKFGNQQTHDITLSPVLTSSNPQISLFMVSRAEQEAPQVRLTVAAIELLEGGQWVSLLRQPMTISSAQAAKGIMLDRVQVSAGQYDRIRYQLSQVVMERDGLETNLQLPPQPIEYPMDPSLTLQQGDSISLFLNWEVPSSLAKAPLFSPAITPMVQHIPLATELAFVSCPEINTVYIIRTDQNRICGSWGIPGRPTYLHSVKERNLLYLLAIDLAVIKVVELSTGKLLDQIRIPMAVKPSYMVVDREGRNAYLLDQATDTLYRVDLRSGSLAAQGRQGGQLGFVTFLDDEQRLAVASKRSQQVLLLDPGTLQVRQTIPVGSDPQGIHSDGQDLFVAEGRGNTVSVYHAGSGTTQRQTVGHGPSRLLLHNRTLYVANTQGGSLSILLPEQLTVVKNIPLGGTPGEMDISLGRNWLYVTDAQGQGVAILDLTNHRLAGKIDLKAQPLDIEVIQ